MSPLPPGFTVPSGDNITSIERLIFRMAYRGLTQYGNTNYIEDNLIEQVVQLYQFPMLNVNPIQYVGIVRVNLPLASNFSDQGRLWDFVQTLGANSQVPSGYAFPGSLNLNSIEKVMAWGVMALHRTFPNALATERVAGSSLRSAIWSIFVDDSQPTSIAYRFIGRLSLVLNATWGEVRAWENVVDLGSTAIPASFQT